MGRMKNITPLLYLLLFAVLGMAGCRSGNNDVDELPVSEPTVTPIVQVAEIPTFTPYGDPGSPRTNLYGNTYIGSYFYSGPESREDQCAGKP